MEYEYRIYGKSADKRWITILSDDEHDCERPDAFIQFAEQVNGAEDNPGLDLSWDPTFCISVTYPEDMSEAQVLWFLSRYTAA